MNKERIEKIKETLSDFEYFVDDDFGGHYENIDFSQKALTPISILSIIEYIEDLQRQSDEKEQKIRLDQTKKVFEVLADAIKNGSISYRNLIYDKLGFTEHYADLIAGLTITNAIVDLEEKDKIIKETVNYIESRKYKNREFPLKDILKIITGDKNE